MKCLIGIVLLMAVYATAKDNRVCYESLTSICDTNTDLDYHKKCNAEYGAVKHNTETIQNYINLELKKSYEYLLLASHFSSYKKNRLGFQKLYQSLSDRSFENAIELIKHITVRGGQANLKQKDTVPFPQLTINELQSLSLALDTEKELATQAIHVHTKAAHGVKKERDSENSETVRDPELAEYLEEKFLTPQAKTIRKISGYANDLSKLMEVDDPSLSIYLFDEFLQKQ